MLKIESIGRSYTTMAMPKIPYPAPLAQMLDRPRVKAHDLTVSHVVLLARPISWVSTTSVSGFPIPVECVCKRLSFKEGLRLVDSDVLHQYCPGVCVPETMTDDGQVAVVLTTLHIGELIQAAATFNEARDDFADLNRLQREVEELCSLPEGAFSENTFYSRLRSLTAYLAKAVTTVSKKSEREYADAYRTVTQVTFAPAHDAWDYYHEDLITMGDLCGPHAEVDEHGLPEHLSKSEVKTMLRCGASAIRDACRDPRNLPVCRPPILMPDQLPLEEADALQTILQILQMIGAALDARGETLALAPRYESLELWKAILASALAPQLLPAYPRAFFRLLSERFTLPSYEYGLGAVTNCEANGSWLQKLAEREFVLIQNQLNWPLINRDFTKSGIVFDLANSTMGDIFATFDFAPALRLSAILGFNVNELDLTRCAITGSCIGFCMDPGAFAGIERACHLVASMEKPPTPWATKLPEGPTLFSKEEYAVFVPDQQVHEGKADATLHLPEGTYRLKLEPGYDVDIAVFSTDAQELKREAEKIFEVVQRYWPSVTLTEEPRTKGSCWVIRPQTVDEFCSLPPIEIFSSSLAHICSHHLAPARACYTAAVPKGAEPAAPRFLATASAVRAFLYRTLDSMHYFASKKTFPQQIIAKYLQRGYGLSPATGAVIEKEVISFLTRHPDWCRIRQVKLYGSTPQDYACTNTSRMLVLPEALADAGLNTYNGRPRLVVRNLPPCAVAKAIETHLIDHPEAVADDCWETIDKTLHM